MYADRAQRKESKLFESIPSTIIKAKKPKESKEEGGVKRSTAIEGEVEVEEEHEQSIKERIELVEDLSSIERYTVYKGRIL